MFEKACLMQRDGLMQRDVQKWRVRKVILGRQRWMPGLGILLLVVSLMGCLGDSDVHLVGTVERTTLELAAPISEVIVSQPGNRGDQIEAGGLILQLDSTVAAAELRAFQAAREAAAAAVAEAEGEFKRMEDLRRARVKTPQDLDRAQRQRDEAVAVLAEKEARIAQAEKRLNDLRIVSRSAGTIDQLPYEVGERVPAGGVVAVVLADDAPWVRVWIPAYAVSRLANQNAVMIQVEGLDEEYQGYIDDVAREPSFTPHFALTERESAHLVYAARVVMRDAPKDLRPGLPARLEIRLGDAS